MEKTIQELMKEKIEKDVAVRNFLNCPTDNTLLLYWWEIDRMKSLDKETFLNYFRDIHNLVEQKSKIVDELGKHFEDSYIIDDNTYAIAENVMVKILEKTFNISKEFAMDEVGYMLECEFFTSDHGLIEYNGVKYKLSNFNIWFNYLRDCYGKKD